uniref:Prenylcysteine lyase n=1 Tax=Mycena chlorophos TaxID=658473 RepID=A0ABQ0LBU4_MYCCL|nr:prenylcysteine lyase [Mycena chlorophos]
MHLGVALLALPTAASALQFQLPFKLPFFQQQPLESSQSTRIAIVGAGAAGSSAAFWIAKAQERSNLSIQVDVYERSSYIGGRSTVVYPYDDPQGYPGVELGASIFIPANRNLWRATHEFNLSRRDFHDEEGLGIWDGTSLVFAATGGWWSWWDTAKALFRYGFHSPRRTQKVVDDMVSKFLTLYSSTPPKWSKLEDLAQTLEWNDLLSKNTADWLEGEGVNHRFISEIVEASTRVNYGHNVDEIHALEGACSLAPTGATAVDGGNFQIFEQFLNRSTANVFLKTSVQSITANSSGKWIVASDRGSQSYDAIILAAPWQSTDIALPEEITIPKQPYVHLHVTLFSTNLSSLPAKSLNLPASTKIPPMLLTTHEGARNGGKEPEFNSLSYHGKISDSEWVVKIFSKQRVSDEWLSKMFDGQVGWVYRKEWDAYPVLPPTASFPQIKLADGLYYSNSFEPFISTMETETISSRNIVDLLLEEHFNTSICGKPELSDTVQKDSDDYVYGWDC